MEKYNYEKVLGDIACYLAAKCELTPSEAVGLIMNDDRTDSIVKEITSDASVLDVQVFANSYLDEAFKIN